MFHLEQESTKNILESGFGPKMVGIQYSLITTVLTAHLLYMPTTN